MLALKLREKVGPELGLLTGLGLGAAFMYLADPHRGRRRRAQVRDKTMWAMNHAGRAIDRSLRDLANRAQGLLTQTIANALPEVLPDEVLHARVQSRLGRLVSHPGAIEVSVREGRVTLRGDVLENEARRLICGLRCMRGVRGVDDYLNIHGEAGSVPGLQGQRTVRCPDFELLRPRWAPATRAVVGAGGLGLMLAGGYRRGLAGGVMGAMGTVMLMRSITNVGPLEGWGLDRRCRGITVQKTAIINAPVERVFELLVNPEKLPRVMEHIQEVKKVDDRHYHWTMRGPAGTTLSWDTEVTEIVPNELLAWRSEPGTMKNAGVLQFEPTGNGGTRVHIRMSYVPPGGFVGETIAELLDADPKHLLDEDMARFKTLVERGKTRVRRRVVKVEELED